MNNTELYKNVITTVRTLLEANAGDEATEYLLLNAGAMILEISSDEMKGLLNHPEISAPEEPWYTENWHREDLENALTDADIEVTPDRVSTLRKACANIWDDLSDRREQLANLAESLFKDDTKLNTKIEYLYRDASNWKRWNTVIVKGVITTEQVGVIMDCLHDGEYFIPQQIGLPEVRFETQNEDDHCWFELGEYSFEPTNRPNDVDMTADELVEKFRAAKGNWDDSLYAIV